jgi:hypothetical protein
MLGIKIVGDLMFFCSMIVREKYLEKISEDLPKDESVTMYKYPKDGLK